MAQKTLRDYLQTAEDAISTSRVPEALANCQYILTHFPESLEAQRLLGEVYLAQGHLDEAQQTFDWVLTNDPENVIAYCDRALICEHLSDYDTALDCYQQAYELSRGNSQIRQEFNQLSVRVGQQGFMFSRAGLARLYMRGDLLPQAIQEWETVLTTNPDRLDARTGLLEAVWREGLYDQVEELATQILDDVPHCLKALLLLAHVSFAQNAQRAQELMRQVERLDPDLVMALDLFSDFIASQPNDPFLKLLKKSPTVFPETSNGKHVESSAPGSLEKVAVEVDRGDSTTGASTFAEPFVRWSSVDNIVEPQQDYQTRADAAPFGNWGNNSSSEIGTWNTFGQQEQQAAQPVPPTPTAHVAQPLQPGSGTLEPEPWDPFEETSNSLVLRDAQPASWPTQPDDKENDDTVVTYEQANVEQQPPWYHVDIFEESSSDPWSSVNNLNPAASTNSWEMEEQASDIPTPPPWLDMLTKGDRLQSSGDMPKLQSSTPPSAQEASTTTTRPEAQQHEEAAIEVPWDEKDYAITASSLPQQEEEEPFFFGPEWLKSLGATAIDSELPPEPEAATAEAMQSEPISAAMPQPDSSWIPSTVPEPASSWSESDIAEPDPAQPAPVVSEELVGAATWQVEEHIAPAPRPKITVENWLEQAAQRLTQPEQNILTTLEELENDLRSQGFRPMEPGTLSAIAAEPSLSSALAELGNFAPQQGNEVQATQPATTNVPSAEPLWSAAPDRVSQTGPQPVLNKSPEHEQASTSHLDALSSLISNADANAAGSTSSEPVHMVQAHALPNLASNSPAVPSPAFNVQQVAAQTPGMQPEMPLEFELEITMKRPAVRLQPMQQRPSPSIQQNQPPARGRSGERSTTGKAADGSLNYKERLLKGYQNQRAGAYDDAMQEYRIIIRNAPDLLDEVVSNMRALLKIAPRYSAGYRVLGDAYMRQGEYLQAMEAYNKALTMAKKAKG